MGFFGTYQFDGATWANGDPDAGPSGQEPWLWVDIYDSDFATVRYAPAGSGSGTAYLNMTPRTYFESDDASAPTDVERESGGLAEWWAATVNSGAPADERDRKRSELATFLASDEEPSDVESDDDADIFAEIKTARFLTTLGVPLPADLQGFVQ